GKIETNEEITRDDPIIKNIYETNEFIQNIVLERMREGHERGLITVDQPALETMLTAWFGICGIIEIASRKKDYLVYRTSKSRDQFLDLAFKLVSRIFAIHPPDA
ncbi:MAG: hypothetical protein LBT38_11905, partial [Deltaproteobacteria bacterium]|nr:hypothetical protein [Deltaproteobacteria bacterium]